jgi:hypothetical protein
MNRAPTKAAFAAPATSKSGRDARAPRVGDGAFIAPSLPTVTRRAGAASPQVPGTLAEPRWGPYRVARLEAQGAKPRIEGASRRIRGSR